MYWICLIVSYKFSKSKLINTNRNHLRSNYEIRCPTQYSRIPCYTLKSVWKQRLSKYPNRPFKCPHETLTQMCSSFHAYSAAKKKNGFGEKVRQNRKSTRNVMARGKVYSLIRGEFRANWKAHHHWIRRLLKNTRQSFEKPPQHDLFLFLFQVGVRVTAILGSVRNLDQGPCRCLPTRNSDIATQRFARELTLFTQRALPSPPTPPWSVSRWVRTYVCTWNRLGACVLDVCVLPSESEYSTKSEHATLPRRI